MSQADEIALSVDETNKLREKLGLKPLRLEDENKEGEPSAPGTNNITNDVLLAPVIPGQEHKDNEIRARLSTQKEKRQIQKKLATVKSLGAADDDDDDSAVAWVKKSRAKSQAQMLADEQAARQAELDAALEEESKPQYDAKDIRGLKVKHDFSDIREESTTILTLADRGVLDDGEDVLQNVNIAEDEKTKMKIEEAKKIGASHATDEMDDPLGLRRKKVLEKYDDIDNNTGLKNIQASKSFVLGQEANVELDPIKAEEERIRERLKGTIALDQPSAIMADDYYTRDEMAKFKKKKRKKTKKKSKTLRASSLAEMTQDAEDGDDNGMDEAPDAPVVDQDTLLDDIENEEDQLEVELQAALNKVRRAKAKASAKRDVASLVLSAPKKVKTEDEEPNQDDKSIVFSQMSEFVRNVGSEDRKADMTKKARAAPQVKQEVMDEEEDVKPQVAEASANVKEEDGVLADEGNVGFSLADTLKVAQRKGLISAEDRKADHAKREEGVKLASDLPSNAVLDTSHERQRDRHHTDYRRGGDPLELKGYKPSFKLEYKDEHGRDVGQKEAFRAMSHAFHGKGSGHNKTEKRMKKIREQDKLKKMTSEDTPLNTASSLRKKLTKTGTTHVVMSGGQTPLSRK